MHIEISYIPHSDSEQVNKHLPLQNGRNYTADSFVLAKVKNDHSWGFLVDLTGPTASSNKYGFTPTY